MTVVKICGITTLEDALMAAEAGADMIGLNFFRKSPRYLAPPDAARLVSDLRSALGDGCPGIIGVFVNESVYDIGTVAMQVGLNAVQLSGDESVEVIRELHTPSFKAVQPPNLAQALDDVRYFTPVMRHEEYLPSLLLDAYHPTLRGGTGARVSADILQAVMQRVPRVMLAGGLTPANVAERVAQFRPWGVDVASGVESGTPGVKDAQKVWDFVVRAKDA